MGYKALITIDLPNVENSERDLFYDFLSDKHWNKINGVTTAWKASFPDGVERDKAVRILKKHLEYAKDASEIMAVKYVIQLAEENIISGELSNE